MQHTLLVDCVDKKGLVYAITKQLLDFDVNIEQNDEFVDNENGHFFMRTVISGLDKPFDLQAEIQRQLPDANIRLFKNEAKKIVLMCTKEPHCLGDLLVRNEFKQMNAEIVAVISNHNKLRALVEKFEIPFHHVPHTNIERAQHETQIHEILAEYNPEYIVLAKYMRILTPSFVARYKHRLINIHHSFLPAFIGANPYKQAYDRGVKIIGATAHYVTDNLDEGPIIFQDVKTVGHRFTAKDMSKAGKDVEKIVLANALKLVFNERVFIYGNKTIIF